MSERAGNIPVGLVGGYLLSLLLVPLYVQMYPVWRVLNEALPARVMQALPVVATLVVLGIIMLAYRSFKQREQPSVKNWAVLSGILLCLAALLVPDPHVPAKRIHVVEYLVLSACVRFAMSYRLQRLELLVFSGLLTALLGIHDEFLQGMHPARTYGLRDMAVNALSGFGGSLIWHGMNLFNRDVEVGDQTTHSVWESLLYLNWLIFSVLALIWPLVYFRPSFLPLWPAAPLGGSMVFFLLSRNSFYRPWKHGILAISLASFCLVIYPLATRIWSLKFF